MEANPVNLVNDTQAIESRIRKKKRIRIDDESLTTGLSLNIRCAQGIDKPNPDPWVFKRQYCVVYWVNPNELFRTEFVDCILNPHWDERDLMMLGNSCDNYGFLNVEVLRTGSLEDPGTSNGFRVVGRARISLPKEFHRESKGCFGLVRMEDGELNCDGFIVLSMELQRVRMISDACF
ncbi:hypothetical protein L6164_031675 [Bauhinia variegata]|uniref:Uncharacterized protein n=1 Tax=Bauhinia variegata TaxID=167791 RepID=A0ACB9LG72_BAUVA|nr:hypothetical protein L6164_031675 [Bauhinia variegata]